MWSFLWLVIVIHFIAGSEKDFIHFGGIICPREEEALQICLRDALNMYFIPQLSKGIPQYDVQCEPLKVPSLLIKESSGLISAVSNFSDVTFKGTSSMKAKEIEVDFDKREMIAKLHIPALTMKGHYQLSGYFLRLPIKAEGEFTAIFDEVDAAVTVIVGRKPRQNDVNALTCERLGVKLRVGFASMHLSNLYGDTMNQFFNENWYKFTEEFQVPMEEALRDFLKPLADFAFSKLNADDILGGFVCPNQEEKLQNCLLDVLNIHIPQLATGAPQYSVPPCDPLKVPSLSVQQSSGPNTVVLFFSNLTVKGPASIRVKEIEMDSENQQLTAKLHIPALKMKGVYQMWGRFFQFHIKCDGNFTTDYDYIDATIKITLGRQLRVNENDALICERMDTYFRVNSLSMQLSNLFKGGTLKNAMNRFINKNWYQLTKDLQAHMEEALRKALKKLINQAFSTFNADDFLTEK